MAHTSKPAPSWRRLPISHPNIPILLFSASFSVSPVSYAVYVTDLAHVWSERLDRKAILLRTLEQATSIDPSDDPDNFGELLKWIGAAFDQGSPHHADTSIAISAGTAQPGVPADLVLDVTCKLPAGLEPLRWPVRLRHGPPAAVADELVLPLLQAHLSRGREIEALFALIAEKDSVIARVVDKLEATGTRLENVFASLTAAGGKKKVTRAVAEARVKGLAPFDQAAFRVRFDGVETRGASEEEVGGDDKSASLPRSVERLVEHAFSDAGVVHYCDVKYADIRGIDGWWESIGPDSDEKAAVLVEWKRKAGPRNCKSEEMASTPSPPARYAGKGKAAKDDNGDDFEVQATPPSLMSARKGRGSGAGKKASSPPPGDDASTDTGDEQDEGEPSTIPDSNPPPRVTASRGEAAQTAKPSRLGAIRKQKRVDPEPEPEPEPTVSADATIKDADTGSETASDAAEDESEAENAPPSPPPPKPAAPRRGGLGRIGGPGQATAKEPSPPPPASSTADDEAPSAKKTDHPAKPQPARRMGKIGNRIGVQGLAKQEVGELVEKKEGGQDDDGTRGRGMARKVDKEEEQATRKQRETSEERADRRREELRVQLEKKTAAGPAKKKRKF